MPGSDLGRDLAGGTAALVAALLLAAGCQGGAPPASPSSPAPTTEPAPSSEPTTEPNVAAQGSAPARVSIESIGVDEPVIGLGIAENGELDVPDDPADVGWFTDGGRPGGRGPTVIVGHLDSSSGPAVFARVPELGPGDVVTVTTTSDDAVEYVVSAVEDFPQKGGFPTGAVFGATADDRLRLITCTGPYDQKAGRYTENRVVFAKPS